MIGKYLPLLASSLRRKRLRTFFTVASILIAFLLYGLAASMQFALKSGVDVAGADRLLTMHKVSFTQLLPASYESRIKAVDGVVAVSPQTWFGAWFQRRAQPVPDVSERSRGRTSASIRRSSSPKRSSRPGSPIAPARWSDAPLPTSTAGRSATRCRCGRPSGAGMDGSDTWDVTVRAIYDLPEGGDTRQIVLHQDYFEEAKQQAKGLIGWYVIKISDVNRAQAIARQIDVMFANSPAETKTSSERAMAQSFVNQIGNIGAILSAIVAAVFFTMLLVTANTMAQSVRERTERTRRAEDARLQQWRRARHGARGVGAGDDARRPARHVLAPGGSACSSAPTLDQYLPGFRVPPEAFVKSVAVHAGARRGRGRGAGLAGDAPAHRRSAAQGLRPP